MRKWIGVALLALMMTLAVMTATVISGEAEASHFVDTDKMICETGEADSHVAALLGMTAPAVVNYDSASEEPSLEEPSLTGQSAAAPDEDYILRVITAEGGADQLVCNGVVQCLYNACQKDCWARSVTEILREYQYTAPAEWISEEARIAWDAVFLSGVTFVDFGEALYFYAPAYCESPWHESQRFVAEVGGVRFFEEVAP